MPPLPSVLITGNLGSSITGTEIASSTLPLPTATFASISSYFSVKDPQFGAKGDGVTDDTAAIQATINSLPSAGGAVLFPPGVYIISSTITVGNGSATAQSSTNGIYLVGTSGPSVPIPSNLVTYQRTAGVVFKATNPFVGSQMVSVLGPIQGWGISNIFFDGGGSTSSHGNVGQGLLVTAGQFGLCQNLSFLNFVVAGLKLTAWQGATGTGIGDTQQCTFINTSVRTPIDNNAKGIFVSGAADAANDTAYVTFIDTFIALNEAANANVNFGILTDVADSCTFINTHIVGGSGGGGSGNAGVVFDYSVNNSFPSGHTFFGFDAASSATFRPVIINGAPVAGLASHQIFGATRSNSMPPPYLAGVAFYSDIALRQTSVAVSSLAVSSSITAGARAIVNDSTVAGSGNYGAVVAGGSNNLVPVYNDGTNWRIG